MDKSPHHGLTVWFTGLSGAGKTTLAAHVFEQLQREGFETELLDADHLRRTLCADLGYSPIDRDIAVRRLGFIADLLTRHNVIVLVAAISPFRETRDEIREAVRRFVEVYVDAPLEVCEERDTKGIYRQARLGKVGDVTGIDHPYEAPVDPEVECRTAEATIEECVAKILANIRAVV